MSIESKIVEALKMERFPYHDDTHRRVATYLEVPKYLVSKAARDHSLILDESRKRLESQIKAHGDPLNDYAELVANMQALEASKRQHDREKAKAQRRHEAGQRIKSLLTVDKITPEFLQKVGMGHDRHFGLDRKM